MTAFLFIPNEVFDEVKDIILDTWFEDEEPWLEQLKDEEYVTICSFTSGCDRDFNLLEKVICGYHVEVFYAIPVIP